jgi:hypothetical protein
MRESWIQIRQFLNLFLNLSIDSTDLGFQEYSDSLRKFPEGYQEVTAAKIVRLF